jgi:putative spermidine/putrescine transport system permease protein
MSSAALVQAPAPARASASRAPWLLSAPAFTLFACLLLVPLVLTAVLSFQVFDHATGAKNSFTLAHYAAVLTDDYYHGIFWRTLWISALTTLICVLIGAPEAYVLSRMRSPWRSILLLVVLAPLLVSVVVRAFGWSMLLGPEGVVNQVMRAVGLPSMRILYTEAAVVIALVHVMLPFMVIPVWTSLQKLDPGVEDAALSLQASHFTTLRRIILPQVLPGILSGSLIVFGLSASAFAIPGLLGGRRLKMVATVVYDEYLHELNWPLGAAIALIFAAGQPGHHAEPTTAWLSVPTESPWDKERTMSKERPPSRCSFNALVITFMLAPLVIVCVVAFTPEQHAGASRPRSFRCAGSARCSRIRTFVAVLQEQPLAGRTLSATLATVLAVPAGLAIARYHSFPGRDFAQRPVPLAADHPAPGAGRGAAAHLLALIGATGSFFWLALAHVVIITPYVLRLVLASVEGSDRSAEQAALIAGRRARRRCSRASPLPMILPGVTGGWLLAFINSFDEVTMSIFVTAPSTVTLPVRMYMYATESIDPLMAAVSALMVALTAVAMLVLDRIYGLDKILVGHK